QRADKQMSANMQKKAKLLHEKYDVFTVNDAMTGYGTAACADVAWRRKHGEPNGARVLVQGFGNVGASAAYRLYKLGYKIVGISDAKQLVVCEDGLDVPYLYEHRTEYLEMDTESLKPEYKVLPNTEWMNVECDIFIPAALEAVINKDTVDKITASVISEGANIPTTEEADKVLRERGTYVIPDFIANLGAIRFHGYARLGLIDFTPESAINDVIKCSEDNTNRLLDENEKTGEYFRDIAYRLFAPTKQSEFEF
ncbi:MAG TPA: Glu/Leu/Phe/Val dehydrogenase, partial [Candidatus Scatomorpha merdigallinarum]|nr:Glu/Leu/Phe/Val dehydrogenase [Candidatus Scatomorpha merdigallinarum]